MSAPFTTGNITADSGAGSVLTVPCMEKGSCSIQVEGTWLATLQFEATLDGTNWIALPVTVIGGSTTVTSVSGNGLWSAAIPAYAEIRVRCSAFTSGTAVVNVSLSASGYVSPGSYSIAASVVSKSESLSVGVSIFDDVGVNPALKSLASAASIVSTAQDNTSVKDQCLDLVLNVKGAVAFTAGSTFDVWVLTSLDGSVYEDGSASVTPARPPDVYFYPRAVNTAQVLILTGIQLPPTKYKILFRNSGGQAFTGVDADNTLSAYTHS